MNKLIATVSTVIITAMLATNLFGQSNATPLSRLVSEPAKLSQMDLILIRTRLFVIENPLDVSRSPELNPTSFSFDSERNKIRIAVRVDSDWLKKANLDTLKQALTTTGLSLCVDVKLANPFELLTTPADFCYMTFFTRIVASSEVIAKDVAEYSAGTLIVR